MRWVSGSRGVLFSMLALAGLLAGGCGRGAPQGPEGAPAPAAAADDHSGWWCGEHGVPEAICARCNPKVAAECQKKGDWCKEHNHPESQCFLCNPKRAEQFAKQYEVKYGKKPPAPQGT